MNDHLFSGLIAMLTTVHAEDSSASGTSSEEQSEVFVRLMITANVSVHLVLKFCLALAQHTSGWRKGSEMEQEVSILFFVFV